MQIADHLTEYVGGAVLGPGPTDDTTVPGDVVGEMTSIGTLFAFILVCAGVWIMRNRRPDVPRGFVVPALPHDRLKTILRKYHLLK